MSSFAAKDKAVIENDFIKADFILGKNKVLSVSVTNKITSETVNYDNTSSLFSLSIKGGIFGSIVNSCELKLENAQAQKNENKDVLLLNFSAFKVKDTALKISVKYESYEDKPYIEKTLIINSENPGKKAVLDYIDLFPVRFSSEVNTSCASLDTKGVYIGIQLYLGQPVFANSFFYGCKFPATLNSAGQVNDISVKYYSGMPISKILQGGSFISKTCVIGACQSSEEAARKASFFDYIESISKPMRFTAQYNSWYDLRLDISDEKIAHSFLEIEKAMTKSGCDPLYCFAVDDGWNDYNGGFWSFNQKFPNELYATDALTRSLGSSLGLWLGPRGGYTTDTIKFARNVQKSANGFINMRSFDIDVASEKYITKTSDFLLDCIEKFNISYLKLDGFLHNPCRNANHDHIVGGYKDMYEYTQLWERWLDVFEKINAKTNGKLFINLTSYAPLSPWLLQWVDSVWIQISNDMGFLKKDAQGRKLSCSKKDMALTYRDDIYYNLFKEKGLVFPLGRLYNHDPIYANCSDENISMSDESFAEYLYTMAGRGNAFWELYYSFDMMNEKKWKINSGVLAFVKENIGLLSKAQLFGCKPAAGGVYGFGAFSEGEGIVTMRNSSSEPKTYVLRLDEKIGVTKSFVNARMLVLLPYNKNGVQGKFSYGDTVKVTLSPYQTKILSFAQKVKLIKADYVKAIDKNKLEVTFNQTVVCDDIKCLSNPIKSCELLEDFRTVVITFENDFSDKQTYLLSEVKDSFLYGSDCNISFTYYENNLVPDKSVLGAGDFSIVVTTGGEEEEELYRQGDEIELSIIGGRVRFMVGDLTVVSNLSSHEVVQICAVRERNGVLKLYLNKALDSAAKPCGRPMVLCGGTVTCFNDGKVRVYNRALDYTEV